MEKSAQADEFKITCSCPNSKKLITKEAATSFTSNEINLSSHSVDSEKSKNKHVRFSVCDIGKVSASTQCDISKSKYDNLSSISELICVIDLNEYKVIESNKNNEKIASDKNTNIVESPRSEPSGSNVSERLKKLRLSAQKLEKYQITPYSRKPDKRYLNVAATQTLECSDSIESLCDCTISLGEIHDCGKKGDTSSSSCSKNFQNIDCFKQYPKHLLERDLGTNVLLLDEKKYLYSDNVVKYKYQMCERGTSDVVSEDLICSGDEKCCQYSCTE